MTKGENFFKSGKCKNKHCSPMSNRAWCDLNSKGDILKLHDKGPNPKCNCQKLITFTPHQYMLESGSNKNKLQKIFRGTQTAWNNFLKSANNAAAPFIGMAVNAKSKNPKVGQATTKFWKTVSEGMFLSLTYMHPGAGLRLRVM